MNRFFLLAGLLLGATAVSAQSLPEWAAPSASPAAVSDGDFAAAPPPPPPPPPAVPIDGGLGLLALAGAGLAARKLRQS